LESVSSFKCLGRIISADDSDVPAVVSNIQKARGRWAMVTRILTREGASPKVSAMFYKAVVQSVLLFGCETWVESNAIMRSLKGFHHYVARKLSGCQIRKRAEGDGWIYPAIGPALEVTGLAPIATYYSRRREYLLTWVRNRPDCEHYETIIGGGAGGSQRKYW